MSASSKNPILTPSFGSAVIQPGRTDGYWIEPFPFHTSDRVPGVVCSGLVSGVIELLDNPIAEAEAAGNSGKVDLEKPWTRYQVGTFKTPVAVINADVNGNGLTDLIICHLYGPFMLDVLTDGGHVSWLENPGRGNLGQPWKEHYIGRWPSMHRLRAGYFTQRAFLEVVAAPIVHGPHDKATPVPILLFTAPDDVYKASEWPRSIIDDTSFTCIHEVVPRKLRGPNELDSLVVSSREGVTILSYNSKAMCWDHEVVGVGEPQTPTQTSDSESPGSGDYWGTGSADVGKVGNDPFAYIATLDPFHGVAACVYTKSETSINGKPKWKRHVLDVYGTPNQRLKTGDGPGHYITCADFDGDGDDEFVLSLYGPLDRDEQGQSIPPAAGPHPYKGIMYYKALDLEKGIFAKWRVADESSARVAVGDFSGSGTLDIASISYNVKLYYEEPNPVTTLHLNNFAPVKAMGSSTPAIFPTLWDNEAMVYLVDPSIPKNQVTSPSVAPLIEVANYAISVEVYPPGHQVPFPENDGAKVIFGSISFLKGSSEDVSETREPFSVDPFTTYTTKSKEPNAHVIADKKLGAVLLRFHPLDSPAHKGPFATAQDVPVKTTLTLPPLSHSALPALEFKRVDSLWWGAAFKDLDFYNLSGIHFYFIAPNATSAAPTHVRLAHIQFWTAAPGVNCGVHNHSQDSFCEVHVALSPGTGNGSMARLKPEYAEKHKPEEYNSLGREAFDWLPMQELDEHGGFWDRNEVGRPVRSVALPDTVKYPWHKWQAGDEGKNVDVWMAIEFNPDAVDRAVGEGQPIVGGDGSLSSGVARRPKRAGGHCC